MANLGSDFLNPAIADQHIACRNPPFVDHLYVPDKVILHNLFLLTL
jgi:hypothetical protein